MRLVLFGSGEFGVPTFQALAAEHDILRVVSQPARPAGRGRSLRPTPVSEWASGRDHPLDEVPDVNDPSVTRSIRSHDADAWVVIAFGQKLGPELLLDRFAVNLHASLLPKFRGAAPINHAIIAGEETTGVSVITLADRIDAGDVLGAVSTRILPAETAGELHDRLSLLGPDVMLEVLDRYRRGDLSPVPQPAAEATVAPKFSRSDGTVDFRADAAAVRNRVHGLTPWPGCDVAIAGQRIRLLRMEVVEAPDEPAAPGCCSPDGVATCGTGYVRLLRVQAPGGRPMDFSAWLRGQRGLHGSPLEITAP